MMEPPLPDGAPVSTEPSIAWISSSNHDVSAAMRVGILPAKIPFHSSLVASMVYSMFDFRT
jgi:hypothetical protein